MISLEQLNKSQTRYEVSKYNPLILTKASLINASLCTVSINGSPCCISGFFSFLFLLEQPCLVVPQVGLRGCNLTLHTVLSIYLGAPTHTNHALLWWCERTESDTKKFIHDSARICPCIGLLASRMNCLSMASSFDAQTIFFCKSDAQTLFSLRGENEEGLRLKFRLKMRN